MSREEAILSPTLVPNDLHVILYYWVITWAPSLEVGFCYKIGHSISYDNTQQSTAYNQKNLCHCLVVFYYNGKQCDIKRNPCKTRRQHAHEIVIKQRITTVKEEQ